MLVIFLRARSLLFGFLLIGLSRISNNGHKFSVL